MTNLRRLRRRDFLEYLLVSAIVPGFVAREVLAQDSSDSEDKAYAEKAKKLADYVNNGISLNGGTVEYNDIDGVTGGKRAIIKLNGTEYVVEYTPLREGVWGKPTQITIRILPGLTRRLFTDRGLTGRTTEGVWDNQLYISDGSRGTQEIRENSKEEYRAALELLVDAYGKNGSSPQIVEK
ncbi:MAG: hypothetical protein ABIH49_01410 [archaeon]